MSIEVRAAETDADLEGWIRVKRAAFPNESAGACRRSVSVTSRANSCYVAELDGEVVGAGSPAPPMCEAVGSSTRECCRMPAAAGSAPRCSIG